VNTGGGVESRTNGDNPSVDYRSSLASGRGCYRGGIHDIAVDHYPCDLLPEFRVSRRPLRGVSMSASWLAATFIQPDF
jgi:hypothetical protein